MNLRTVKQSNESFQMGRIFQFPYRTFVEVNLRSLIKNLYTLRAISKKEVIPVLKADAYGHGVLPVAKALVEKGSCDMVAVATLEEGIDLRKHLPSGSEILVLSGYVTHQNDAYIKHRLTPMLHTLSHLRGLVGQNKIPPFHIEVDTGMHRLGLTLDEIPEALKILKKISEKAYGLATHFAESENILSPFTDQQVQLFDDIVKTFYNEKLLQTDARIHASNSGAILRRKTTFANAVRPGLSLFGVSPNPRIEESSQLVPVLQWKARILAEKKILKDSYVGYSRTYKASKSEKLAVIGIGYGDGYPRLLGNLGQILVQGKRAPIRGVVSMDLTTVDCSLIKDSKEGLITTILGKEGAEEISAWDLANWAQTIPYEIFCGISPRVPRIYLE